MYISNWYFLVFMLINIKHTANVLTIKTMDFDHEHLITWILLFGPFGQPRHMGISILLLSAVLHCKCFDHKSYGIDHVPIPPKRLWAFHHSFNESYALVAQMAQTVKFMWSNVAYRPTVYKTGVVLLSCTILRKT